MEAKHTAGPWKSDRVFIDNAPDRMIVHVDKFGGRNIADCGEFAGDRVNIDNARLIAAAPDMLAALKDANRMLDIAKRYFPKSIRDNNRFALLNVQANSVMKAIVKAEGK